MVAAIGFHPTRLYPVDALPEERPPKQVAEVDRETSLT